MPELPEAETIVRGLRPRLEGRRILRVEVIHDDLLREDRASFVRGIEGCTVAGVDRRGKNVLLHLGEEPDDPGRVGGSGGSDGAGGPDSAGGGAPHPSGTLVVNLGMTGSLLLRDPRAGREDLTHPAVVFHLGDPAEGLLVYHDVRRFGELFRLEPEAFRAWSGRLGPEPLARAFTARALEDTLTRSRSPVRSWLLDQRRVAGVGNIYAVEALFRARIHPARRGTTFRPDEVRRLHRALRAVLREAVEGGGTTLRDYRNDRGEAGSFRRRLRAYGREGEPCPRCRTPLARIVLSNRSAFFCPRCQPERPRAGKGSGT